MKPNIPACTDCAYHALSDVGVHVCGAPAAIDGAGQGGTATEDGSDAPTSPIAERPICDGMRRMGAPCGPRAKYWVMRHRHAHSSF